MNRRTSKATNNEVWVDSYGIIHHRLRGPQSRQDIIMLREATLPLIAQLKAECKSILILADIRKVSHVDSTVRTEAKKLLDIDCDGVAIVTNRYLGPMVKFVVRTKDLSHKVHVFSFEATALSWLRRHEVQEPTSTLSPTNPIRSTLVAFLLLILTVLATVGAYYEITIQANKESMPTVILVWGLALSFFLSLAFWLQIRSRRQAIKLAEAMTEDLKREQNLATAARNKYKIILRHINEGVFAIDKAGKIVAFNAAAARISGYKASEVLGKPYASLLVFRDRSGSQENDFIKVALQGNADETSHFRRLIQKSGDRVSVSCKAAPIFNAEGKQQNVIVIFSRQTDNNNTEV